MAEAREASSNGSNSRHKRQWTGNSPPAKRHRVSRACDQCRIEREKCDGIQPICSTCSSADRACTYKTVPKRRGIQPGYIRTLESMAAWTFLNMSGSEERLKSVLSSVSSVDQPSLGDKDSERAERLHKTWRDSPVCKALEKMLAGNDAADIASQIAARMEEQDDGNEDNGTRAPMHPQRDIQFQLPEYLDTPATSNGAACVVSPRPAKNHMPNPVEIGSAVSTGAEASLDFLAASLHVPKRLDVLRLRLPVNAWNLLDKYFAYTHCWFPIVEKHDILRIYYTYTLQPLGISPQLADCSDHAVLWSILALVSMPDMLLLRDHGEMQQILQSNSPTDSVTIYNIAISLIPQEHSQLRLGHVQALLILAILDLQCRNWSASWLHIGQAARIAIDIGIHQDLRSGLDDNRSKRSGREKHVFFGCFILDTLVSAKLGRRPYLRFSDITKVGLLEEEGPDEWHPWEGCHSFRLADEYHSSMTRNPLRSLSIFNRLAQLFTVLNQFELLNMGGGETDALDRGRDPFLELQNWANEVETTLNINLSKPLSIAVTPQLLVLQLCYACVARKCGLRSGLRRNTDVVDQYNSSFGLNVLPPVTETLLLLGGDDEQTAHISADNTLHVSTANPSKVQPSAYSDTQGMNFPQGLLRLGSPNRMQALESDHAAITAIPLSVAPTVQQRSASAVSGTRPQLRANTGMTATSGPFVPASYLSRPTGSEEGPLGSLPQRSAMPNFPSQVFSPMSRHIPGLNFFDDSGYRSTYGAPPEDQNAAQVNEQSFYRQDQGRIGFSQMQNPDASSIDIDALLDELTSFDGAPHLDSRPQFMQNLGFAQDADLTGLYSELWPP